MPDQTTPTPRPAVFKVNGRPLPYELHPLCAAWPLMPDAELRELAADIKANGLREPLTLLDGKCLEGQNRMTACALNGDFDPPTVVYEGDDPMAFVISRNRHRRHMSDTALAFVAASLATLRRSDNRGNQYTGGIPANAGMQDQAKPAAAIAAEIGVPLTSVENARAVLDKGTPEVAALVQAGDVPLRAGADYARHTPKAEQQADPAVIRQASTRPKPPRPVLNPRAPAAVRHAADFIATHTAEEIEAEIAAGAAEAREEAAAAKAKEAALRASIEALGQRPIQGQQPAGAPSRTAAATKPEPAMPDEEDWDLFAEERGLIEDFARQTAEDWDTIDDALRAVALRAFDALEASVARARQTIEAVAGPQQPRPQQQQQPPAATPSPDVAALQQENATLRQERDRLKDEIIWLTERVSTLTAELSVDPRWLNRGLS